MSPKVHTITPEAHEVLELAFRVQDPAGEHAIKLAREALRLIHDRDDAHCVALTSELRSLNAKYRR